MAWPQTQPCPLFVCRLFLISNLVVLHVHVGTASESTSCAPQNGVNLMQLGTRRGIKAAPLKKLEAASTALRGVFIRPRSCTSARALQATPTSTLESVKKKIAPEPRNAVPWSMAQGNGTESDSYLNSSKTGVFDVKLGSELQTSGFVKHSAVQETTGSKHTKSKEGGHVNVKQTSDLQPSPSISHIPVSGEGGVVAGSPETKPVYGKMTAIGKESRKRKVSFGRILLMGVMYGFIHAIAPDHMGTLMTLSAVEKPLRAFNVGAIWGLGHCVGMAGTAVVFVVMQQATHVSLERWEHLGDYLIGLSMVACALYFIFAERRYLEIREDGTYVSRSCLCNCAGMHTPITGAPNAQPRTPAAGQAGRFRRSRRMPFLSLSEEFSMCRPRNESPAQVPEVPKSAEKTSDGGERTCYGCALGLLQGACCPMGLLGISFLARLPLGGVIFFSAIFLVCSALGTGLIAMSWAYLTSHNFGGGSLTPKAVYRACCCCTLALGIAWIVANYFGVIDQLDYTESLSSAPSIFAS